MRKSLKKLEGIGIMNKEVYYSVNEILETSEDCVKAFRLGDNGLGYGKILELIEKIQLFTMMISDLVTVDGKLKNQFENFNAILLQVNEAIINRDNVLISDIIEFELIPLISLFKE